MRLCLLLLFLMYGQQINSFDVANDTEEPAHTVTPSHPPQSTTPTHLCPADFLDYITHPNVTGEGEVPIAMETDAERPDDEDDVISFAEFKEKMSVQGTETQEVRPNTGKVVTRNYASTECGAKVIEHNPNARSPSAILNSNKDLYLINECSEPIYFVVELCELISVRTIVIASLELFSSRPKTFKVYAAERYEADEGCDWGYIGTFLAANERSEQSFPLNSEEQVYAKYIKVVMESHYGQERVCPINTFKVIGASMIEVYEESQQEVGVASQPSVIPPSEGLGEEDSLLDAPSDGTDTEYNGTLLSAAKDAVLRILEQPLEILGTVIKPDGKASNGDHGNQNEEIPTEHAQNEPATTEEVTEKERDEGMKFDEQVSPEDQVESSVATGDIPQEDKIQLPADSHPVDDTDTLQQSEGQADQSAGSSEVKGQPEQPPVITTVELVEEVSKEETSTPPSVAIDTENQSISESTKDESSSHDDKLLGPLDEGAPDSLGLDLGEIPSLQAGESPLESEPLGPTAAPDVGEFPTLEEEPPLAAPGTVEELSSSEAPNQTPSIETSVVSPASLSTADGQEPTTVIMSASPLPTANETTLAKQAVNASANTTSNGGNKGGKNESESAATNGNHVVSNGNHLVTNGNGVPSAPRDKEKSVFLRLSNQIRELEVNMTLFSSYLDQISTGLKRNKNKTDDTTRSLDRRLTALNETLQSLRNETELKVQLLQGLSSELQTMTQTVVNTTVEVASMDDKILLSLFLVIGLQAVLFIPLLLLCYRQTRNQRDLIDDIQQLKSTIQLLSQQSNVSNGGHCLTLSHSHSVTPSRPPHSTHRRTLSHTPHVDTDGLSTSHSLPLLHAQDSNDDSSWLIAEGRHKKKQKLKTKSAF